MPDSRLIKADLLTAIVLLAFGIFVVVESLDMPRFADRNINPWTAPGIVPGMLGAILVFLAVLLLIRSVAHVGRSGRAAPAPDVEDRPLQRLALTLVLSLGYAAGLLGNVAFWFATGLYVFLFIAVFEWRPGLDNRAKGRLLGGALLQAGVVAVAVKLVFEDLFLVRLP